MDNLATPAEMVEDILHSPELQRKISADAFIGLLQLAHEQEKAACGKQAETNVKIMGTNSLPQLLITGQALRYQRGVELVGTYKETNIPEIENEQATGNCDGCLTEIQKGQLVRKLGDKVYCSRSCLDSKLNIITFRV